MKYNFGDILNSDMYDNTAVMFVFGKHMLFNNIVCDHFRQLSKSNISVGTSNSTIEVEDEFGVEASEDSESTSVSFDTFMNIVGVPSLYGKWFCRVELSTLSKNQLKKLMDYIKNPNSNGILIVTSSDWKTYSYYLKNKVLSISSTASMIELSFPRRDTLKKLVKQMFEDKGLGINEAAIDFFLTRMSQTYEKYEEVISDICERHLESLSAHEVENDVLTMVDMKTYMKGIEYYVIDDFLYELVKPLKNDKTNNKKVFRMMVALQDSLTAKTLVFKLLKEVDELINFRILINSGIIPIGINYFYEDVIKMIVDKYGDSTSSAEDVDAKGNSKNVNEFIKISKMSEYKFKRKAYLASLTSLRDWEYMKIMLSYPVINNKNTEEQTENLCVKALYEVCTRSVLTESRLQNDIGIDNIFDHALDRLDNTRFIDRKVE